MPLATFLQLSPKKKISSLSFPNAASYSLKPKSSTFNNPGMPSKNLFRYRDIDGKRQNDMLHSDENFLTTL